MSKEDEKAVQAEKKASNERAENKAAFSAALKNELDQRAEQLVSTLGAEGVDITKQLAPLVKDVFAGMLRAVTEAAEDLQQADSEAARKQLKTQQLLSSLKLETARTASEVALTNTKMELEAQHHRALEEKLQAMSNDEGSALKEAHAKLEECEAKLNSAEMKCKTNEEGMRSIGKLLDASEAKVRRLTAELESSQSQTAKVVEDLVETKQQLDEARRDLQNAAQDRATVGEKMGELGAAFERAEARCTALQAELAQGDQAKVQKIALLEHDGDLLRQEISVATSTLHEVMGAVDLKVDSSASLSDQIKLVESMLQQQMDAKRDVDESLREVADDDEELGSVLNTARGEGLTLADQIRLVAAQYYSMRDENRENEHALEDALTDLSLAFHEDQTFEERVRLLVVAFMTEREEGKSRAAELKEDHAKLEEEHVKLEEEYAKLKADQELIKTGAAGELQKARTEISRLKTETKEALDTIAHVISDLNITREENASLNEQVKALVESYTSAKRDVEDCLRRVRESEAELNAALAQINPLKVENRTLGEQVRELVSQYDAARKEISDCKQMLNDALKNLELTKSENMTLAEKIKELVSAFGDSKQEIKESKAMLAQALRDLNIAKSEKMTLAEQIKELVRNYEQSAALMKREVMESKAPLEKALHDLDAANSEKKTLGDHLRELVTKFEDLKKGAGQAHYKLFAMEQELAEVKLDNRQLRKEMRQIQIDLDEALSSVVGLTYDKKQLSEQVKELIRRYRTQKDELERKAGEHTKMSKRSEDAIRQAERVVQEAEARVRAIQEQSVKERTALVGSALRSMNEIRTRVGSQWPRDGMPNEMLIQEPLDQTSVDEKMAFVARKPMAPARDGMSDLMVVRLRTPDARPQSARPLPPSARHRRPTSPRNPPRRPRAATAPDALLIRQPPPQDHDQIMVAQGTRPGGPDALPLP